MLHKIKFKFMEVNDEKKYKTKNCYAGSNL